MSKSSLEDVVDIRLKGISEGVKEQCRIVPEIGKGVKEPLSEKGCDPVCGARPLNRAIQRETLLWILFAHQIANRLVKEGECTWA